MKIVQISMKVKPNLTLQSVEIGYRQTAGTIGIYTFCGDIHEEYENSRQ